MEQQALCTATTKIPAWLPAPLRKLLSGALINFKLTSTPRLAARRPVKIPVSVWAEKNRKVTEGNTPGPWKNDIAPHTVKIMDTFSLPWVNEIWFCKVEQSGGTNTLINCMLWGIDCDPGDIFLLLPTEDISQKVVGKKIKPALQQSNRVKDLVSLAADDTTMKKITLRNSVTILPSWANSPSSMATFSAKYAFGSEVDKYPKMAGKETDPISLIRKRGRTFRGRVKRLFESTCGDGGFIYTGTMSCHQVWRYDVRCPDCAALVQMDTDHLVVPDDATADNIDTVEIGYSCNACGTIWNDYRREQAIRSGRWVCIKGDDNKKPRRVGFHHRAWECLDIPLAEIAGAFLRAKDGDLSAKIAWANGYEAIDYVTETIGTRDEEHLLRYRGDFPRNAVPLDTAMLGLLVDTQQDSFFYEVWAFGYAPDISMRMIRHGQLETFDDIDYLIEQESFVDADGKEFRIVTGLIDSGGTRRQWQKHSRTVEVYEYCSRQRKMQPLKGMANRTGTLISYQGVSVFPNTNKKIPGGLRRADIKVDLFKDDLERRLQIEPDDRGALLFHDEVDEAFFKHYTSEIKDDNGDWTHDRKRGRNDYWDCTVYALALREKLKTKIPRKPDDEPKPRKRFTVSKGVSIDG